MVDDAGTDAVGVIVVGATVTGANVTGCPFCATLVGDAVVGDTVVGAKLVGPAHTVKPPNVSWKSDCHETFIPAATYRLTGPMEPTYDVEPIVRPSQQLSSTLKYVLEISASRSNWKVHLSSFP